MSEIVSLLPFEEYLLRDAISAHGLMLVERSPLHYVDSIQRPKPSTPAQALGTLIHLCVLEPEEAARRVMVEPSVDKRTKVGKEAIADFVTRCPDDALIVTADQYETSQRAAESVRAHPFASALLNEGDAEQSLFWTDDGTQVKCKARADFVCAGHDLIVDLKTTQNAAYDDFKWSAKRYNYAIQAAHYIEAAKGVGLGSRGFVFLCVETLPPYGVALYTLSDRRLQEGYIRRNRALDAYKECNQSGKWNGYVQTIQELDW